MGACALAAPLLTEDSEMSDPERSTLWACPHNGHQHTTVRVLKSTEKPRIQALPPKFHPPGPVHTPVG